MVAWADTVVVFADVDGVLLDRKRDSFEDAADALDLLSKRDVPLVLCSGKTRAQIERISQQLGMRHPFICEHGAAIVIPVGYFGYVPGSRAAAGCDIVEFGRSYDVVVGALRRAAERCRVAVVGFADMTTDEVARACGLSLLEARLAKLREYDEPFRMVRDAAPGRARLFRALRSAGFGCRRGEHFDHVGPSVELGASVRLVSTLYRRAFGPGITTIGFGLAADHAPLLRAVDRAFVLHEDGRAPCVDLLQIAATETVTQPGVAGWAATVTRLVGRRDRSLLRAR